MSIQYVKVTGNHNVKIIFRPYLLRQALTDLGLRQTKTEIILGLFRSINISPAEMKTFSVFAISPSYALHLLKSVTSSKVSISRRLPQK